MAEGSCAFSDLARSCWGSGGFGGIAGGGGRGGAGGAMAGDGPGGGVVGHGRVDVPAVELALGGLAVLTQLKQRQREVPGPVAHAVDRELGPHRLLVPLAVRELQRLGQSGEDRKSTRLNSSH